jgi:HemY protein
MKSLIWALLLALIAAALALAAQFNDGNVAILVPPYRIDLSLNLYLLLSALFAIVVYVIAFVAHRAFDFPRQVTLYQERREIVGGQRALKEALQALLEGRFARAERAAKAAQSSTESAGLAALIGARAAHRMQEFDRRDTWLQSAAADRSVQAARLVSSAEMWAESRENDRALDAIRGVQAGGSRHIHAARIALAAYAQAGRWDELLKSVRALAKRNALHEVLVARYKRLSYRARLMEKRHDAGLFEGALSHIPAEDRREPGLAADAARWLAALDRGASAAHLLEDALAHEWDPRLIEAYGQIDAPPYRERIEKCEDWLRDHPNDAVLLRCVGRLCMREQLWGKAAQYLAESATILPHPDTSIARAQLAELTDDKASAHEHYRDAALAYARLAQSVERDLSARVSRRDASI